MAAAKVEVLQSEALAQQQIERETAARAAAEREVEAKRKATENAAAERAAVEAAEAARVRAAEEAERAAKAKARAAEKAAAAERAAAERKAAAEREEADRKVAAELKAAEERVALARAKTRERQAAEEERDLTVVWRLCPVCSEPARGLCTACMVTTTIPSGEAPGFGLEELEADRTHLVWPRHYHVYIEGTEPGSFAEQHGLHFGHALTAVNGQSTENKVRARRWRPDGKGERVRG